MLLSLSVSGVQQAFESSEDQSLADDINSYLYLIRRCSCCITCFDCLEIVSYLFTQI